MKKKIFLMLVTVLSMWASQSFAHGDEENEQTAWGIAGDAKHVSRTIIVDMSDTMKFLSGDLKVKKGDTIKFVVKNSDHHMKHEMVIATLGELKEHAEYMKKFPNMEHSEPNMTSVEQGKSGEIIWTFNKAGEFYYACLVAGHMEAGMINKITVK